MSDSRRAIPKGDASEDAAYDASEDAAYYVEEHESGWRVTYNDAPIGIFKDAGDASRFACDLARIQAQIGRVTWVIVLAEVEEVHRFETRAGSIKPPIEAGCPLGEDRGVKGSRWKGLIGVLARRLSGETSPERGDVMV